MSAWRFLNLIVAATAILASGCNTGRDGYPLGSVQQAEQIETKSQMLERYGVPNLVLWEEDHWLYVYRTSVSRGLGVSFGPGGLLGGVAYDNSTSDVLQFRVDDDENILSVTPLFAEPEAEYRLWPARRQCTRSKAYSSGL
jgi:hypothetical protein